MDIQQDTRALYFPINFTNYKFTFILFWFATPFCYFQGYWGFTLAKLSVNMNTNSHCSQPCTSRFFMRGLWFYCTFIFCSFLVRSGDGFIHSRCTQTHICTQSPPMTDQHGQQTSAFTDTTYTLIALT